MRVFRYFVILVALLGAISCVQSNVDEPITANSGKQIQIVGRVASFSDRNVSSRAFKVGDEGNTATMCLLVFDNGRCIRKDYRDDGNFTFTLSSDILRTGVELWIFANIENPTLDVGNSVEEFLALQNDVTTVDMPVINGTRCFPMYGSYVIGESIDPIIQIPLEAIYSKVVVNILSKPDQTVVGNAPASFSLTKYEVHNVVKSVDFVHGTISVKGEGGSNDTTEVSTAIYEGSNITSDLAQADKQASFYFYLPERYLKPNTPVGSYTYPFGKISDLDEDEAKRLPQCYKPKYAADCCEKAATFVRFFGEYIDHQGHNWNVWYDIYVGNDNYSNFDIEANTQYNNYVTIKGISKSNDQTQSDQTVSIDHRVNIERVNPVIINLRRETLLDSHFEVRPLRIRANQNFMGDWKEAKIKIDVVYNDDDPAKNTPNKRWVGIERSFGDGKTQTNAGGTYLVASELSATNRTNAAGKRRYFTSDLTTNTLATNGQSITLDVTSTTDETIWIYVDECTDTGDDVRSANIRISFALDGQDFGSQYTDFTINQRKLFPVTYGGNTYHIEYHEEYLHNYDAEDSHGQTEYEGMEWGLNDIQFSDTTYAILMVTGSWGSVDEDVYNKLKTYSPFYDFYLERDVDIENLYTPSGVTLYHNRYGQSFCSKIITKASIPYNNLGESPQSAVQYCYNKNKRNTDGTVTQSWYLPAIDEIEDIVMSTYGDGEYSYSRFPDFRAKNYWSCQPAYKNNFLFVERALGDRWGWYMVDNIERARATSVSYNGQGASDPNNYSKKTSGMSGYFKYIDADYSLFGSLSNMNEIEVGENTSKSFSGSNSKLNISETVTKPVYDSCALMRTSMARVRCVRKQ